MVKLHSSGCKSQSMHQFMSPPSESSLSGSQVPTLDEVVWWQCSPEWTMQPIRTDLRGWAFLQDGDVSAHDISLAAEETRMLGPQARHLTCKDARKAFWASALFGHVVLRVHCLLHSLLLSGCFVKYVLLSLVLLDAECTGVDAASISLRLSLSRSVSFLSVVYLYQLLQL